MTLGLISCSVHSRRGSRGVGKLSESGLSRIADTSLDLGEGSGSSILSNNQPQFRIFKISVADRKKTGYVLPVGLGSSSGRVARGVEFESDEAKSVGNSNLLTVQRLLVCGRFDSAKGLIVNDHQIEGWKIFWSLKLQKGIRFEIGPISKFGQGRTRRCQCRVSDQQIQIEGVPQMAMQNNCMASDYQKGYAGFVECKEYRSKNRHALNSWNQCFLQMRGPGSGYGSPFIVRHSPFGRLPDALFEGKVHHRDTATRAAGATTLSKTVTS